jgi:hypothetical protein
VTADDPSAADTADTELAEQLAEATARMAGRLFFAVAAHTTTDSFALAAAPVVVVFARSPDEAAPMQHRSGRIAPSLLPFLVDATTRTRKRAALARGYDNPYLIALVLACFYVVEAGRSGALGLGALAARTPAVRVVADQAALRDAVLAPGSTVLRAVTGVEASDGAPRTVALDLMWQ